MVRLDNEAEADGALLNVMVYVPVVTPSCAVTTVVITLVPTFSAIAPDGLPDTTVVPLTFTVAAASLVVGVTVMLVMALPTLAV